MRLRKGREFMKKIISLVSALILVGCIAVVFYGCGADDKDMTTTTPALSTVPVTDNMEETDMMDENAGKVTDVSDTNDNGLIGDVVTDISEGLSDVVTDVSEDVSQIME